MINDQVNEIIKELRSIRCRVNSLSVLILDLLEDEQKSSKLSQKEKNILSFNLAELAAEISSRNIRQ